MLLNEKGSSLLLVLMVITIFSIIGLSIVGQTVTTSKQLNMMGSNMQATNLAEMGTFHLREEVHEILKISTGKTREEVKAILEERLPSNTFFQSSTGNFPKYKIERNSPVYIESINNIEHVVIPFTTIGYSKGLKEKSISGKILATSNFPLVPVGVDPITGTPTYKKDGDFDGTVYYSEGFSLDSNTTMTYDLDLYSNGDVSLVSNTEIWVKGDAYVNDLNLKTTGTLDGNNSNQSLMCVEGTLTIYGVKPNVITEERDSIDCQAIIDYNNYSGIFATKIIYLPHWKLLSDIQYD